MRAALLAAALMALSLSAQAAVTAPEDAEALARSRAVLGDTLPDLAFRDTEGRTVRLAELRGRPLLISLVYTACSDICPTLVQNLYPIIENAQEMFGADGFRVVTIGFDAARDTPERMRSFARSQGVDLPGWQFLSADQKTIDALTEAVGFTIYPYAGGFGHLAQVTVVDAEGRIYRQIYGASFDPPQIIEPLKDLVYGRYRPMAGIEDVLDRVRLFCTIYDPNTGRYYFNYSLIIRIVIGGGALLLVLLVIVREWRRSPPRTGPSSLH